MGKVGWQARGGPQRDIDVLVEFQLNKVSETVLKVIDTAMGHAVVFE